MNDIFKGMIYGMSTPLLDKKPTDRQALENALVRVNENEGRVMAAFNYQKPLRKKSDAKAGKDFVDIEGIDRDFHLVLIEKVEHGKHGIMIFGKDFMRGNGKKPFALRKFRVSAISSFSVTGAMAPLSAFKASEAA